MPTSSIPENLAAALADRYTLERELGRGGMAAVYLAHDVARHRSVALKVLHPELSAALGSDRFIREIELTGTLQHPHILPLFDSGEAAGLLYYVMPYVEGESLRDRLAREGQLPVADAVQITIGVADALSYAHAHGVIHRDIKPDNILLTSGHAIVADFGIAKAIAASDAAALTSTGLAVGTPAYMSPEQAGGERHVDGRSDIYSLACVLYEMLAGEPPFTGPSAQAVVARHYAEPPRSLRVVRPAVSPALERAVETALAKAPADRYQSAAELARVLTLAITTESAPRTRTPQLTTALRRSWAGPAVAAALVALVTAAAWLWRARSAGAALDADLVAVAPFDAVGPGVELWREGLVDVLSRDLDGAGTLRAVTPTVVVRRWRNRRADRTSAAELGHRTGAGLAVFGSVVASGSDSVRLAATVLDVADDRLLGDVEVRGALVDMDRMTDSVAIALLRTLRRTRAVGAARHTGLGARSVPALKAFLQAEQFYRRGVWDSTQAYAEQAIALDSTFVLAYRLLSHAIGWQSEFGADSITNAARMRTGGMNRGLPPRDSLLVLVDSLTGSLAGGSRNDPALGARTFAVLEVLVRRYPTDPEAWYQLAEARHHLSSWMFSTGARSTLDAFERAIALDSLFAPAYFHPIELSLILGDTAQARHFAAMLLQLNPRGDHARVVRAALQLLTLPDSSARARAVDTLPADVIVWTYGSMLQRWADPAERPLQLAQAFGRAVNSPSDLGVRLTLAQALAWRGRLREALQYREGAEFIYFADVLPDAIALGLVPEAQVETAYGPWLAGQPLAHSVGALPWWSARRDLPALSRFVQAAERAAHTGGAEDSIWSSQLAAAGRAHLALASGDTTAALAAYEPMLDGPCPWWCQSERLGAARLLIDQGRFREAMRVLDRAPTREGDIPPRPSDVLWYLERARVAERLGQPDRASEAYHHVLVAWQRADPELQRYTEEARAALQRLSGEP